MVRKNVKIPAKKNPLSCGKEDEYRTVLRES